MFIDGMTLVSLKRLHIEPLTVKAGSNRILRVYQKFSAGYLPREQ